MPRQRHRHRISFALDDFYMTLPGREKLSRSKTDTHHKMHTANDRNRWPYRLLVYLFAKKQAVTFWTNM
jgi:hypothetical protein